jgi:hypothetical protein
MKMFEMLDAMYRKSLVDEITPVNVPKHATDKITDIKAYKRQYYLQNLQTYKERNLRYRMKKWKEATLDWMLEKEILNSEE